MWIPCAFVFSCSVVSDSATPWTAAHQAPLSMEFSRLEYWSGFPFATPEHLLGSLIHYPPNEQLRYFQFF